MTSDDESFLSAYMDGQLGADEQQWVESALVSNPRLAEQLRSLTSLRDLVAGLSRDAPVDVAPRVMARIKGLSPPGTVSPALAWWRFRSRRLFSPNGNLAAAAGLLVAATLFLVQSILVHRADRGSAVTVVKGPTSTDPKVPALPDHVTVAPSNDRDRASSSHTVKIRSGATGMDEAIAGTGVGRLHSPELVESSASRDLENVRRYLDHPNLRRLFFVKNPRGGTAARKVASIVERTTRHDFFKITISQGIVIDPRHPDQATVFAVVVGASDLSSLADQLKSALPGLFEESPVEPGIVTQLAEASQVQSLPAAPGVGQVSIPKADLALLAKDLSGGEAAGQSGKAGSTRSAGEPERTTTLEQEQSAPVTPPARPSGSDSQPEPARRPPGIGNRESGIVSSHRANANDSQTAKSSAGSMVRDDEIVVLVWVYESGPT